MVVLGYLPKLKRGLGLKAMADRGRGGGGGEGKTKIQKSKYLENKKSF